MAQLSVSLLVIFAVVLIAGVVGFALHRYFLGLIDGHVSMKWIKNYEDDPDLHDLTNYVQKEVSILKKAVFLFFWLLLNNMGPCMLDLIQVKGIRMSPLWAPRSWTHAPALAHLRRSRAGALVHECGAHSGLLRTPPPPYLNPIKRTWATTLFVVHVLRCIVGWLQRLDEKYLFQLLHIEPRQATALCGSALLLPARNTGAWIGSFYCCDMKSFVSDNLWLFVSNFTYRVNTKLLGYVLLYFRNNQDFLWITIAVRICKAYR